MALSAKLGILCVYVILGIRWMFVDAILLGEELSYGDYRNIIKVFVVL